MVENMGDSLVHIIVTILTQPATEPHTLLALSQLSVGIGQSVVLVVVDWIVRLLTGCPLQRILISDHCVGLLTELEMLVFDDARVWCFGIGIVEHRIALEIGYAPQEFVLEPQRAELEFSKPVIEKGVERTCVDHSVGHRKKSIFVGQKVGLKPHLYTFEQFLEERSVAANRNALEGVVEVVVVEGEPQRHAAQHEGGNLVGRSPPLLFGIALDELGEDVLACQFHPLLVEVARLVNSGKLGLLLLYTAACLVGGMNVGPQFAEGVHIERQIVELAFVVGNRAVDVIVEAAKVVDITPYTFVGGVENMRTVAMHIDIGHRLGVAVAAYMGATLDDKAFFASLSCLISKHRAIESSANNKIIVHFS